jgi:hypothetical protein
LGREQPDAALALCAQAGTFNSTAMSEDFDDTGSR